MCNKCGLNEKHGRSGMCKPCKNEYNRQHYAANKQYYVDKAEETRLKIRLALQTIKATTPCADCSQTYPYYVMDFDHLGDKAFTISEYQGNSMRKVLEEVAKCDVVCANCHRIRTHTRGSHGFALVQD